MGVIVKQSVTSSIFSYLGVIIGFILVGFIQPRYMDIEEIGMIRQIQNYAFLLAAIVGIGVPQSMARMFPYFKSPTNNNYGFNSLVLFATIVSSILFSILFWIFKDWFFKQDVANTPHLGPYIYLILPFTLITVFFNLFDSLASINLESAIGTISKDFILRFLILGLFCGYLFFNLYDYTTLISYYSFIHIVPVVIIILYLLKKDKFTLTKSFSFPSKKVKNDYISNTLFTWINGLSAIAVVSIDAVMISKYGNSEHVAIYTTVIMFPALMLIPNRNITKISAPIIAQHLKNNDLKSIANIYSRSAELALVTGAFLLGGLLICMPLTFETILANKFSAGKGVLIFIGISNLIKMASGVKYSIISNSQYYKWTTYSFSGFVLLLIITNIILIPSYGITGAALASLISTSLFNIFGVIFVYKKFNLHPFSHKFIYSIFGISACWGIAYLIPISLEYHLDEIIKSVIFTTLTALFLIQFSIVPELNNLLKKFRGKV